MKRLLPLLIAITIFQNEADAQGFFIKGGLGYAFPNAGQTLSVNGLPYSGTATFTQANGFEQYDMKSVSMAAGMQAIIGACYMFNSSIGIELDANINVSPSKATATVEYETTSGDIVNQRSSYYGDNPLVLHPALYMQMSKGKWGLYARGGLAIPMGVQVVREDLVALVAAGTTTTETYNITQQFTPRMALGFSGGMGATYMIAPYINIFAEGNLQSLSLYVDRSEYTRFEINGQNLLAQIPSQSRITHYGTSRSNSAEPTFSFPFSSMAINVGVKFDF